MFRTWILRAPVGGIPVAAWVLSGLLAAVLPAHAADFFTLSEMTKEIKEALAREKQQTIAIGDFTGSSRTSSTNAGPGIQQQLMKKLEAQGIRLDKDARFEIKGDYDVKLVDKRIEFKLRARLLDNSGDTVVELQPRTEHCTTAEIAALCGVTAALPLPKFKPFSGQSAEEVKEVWDRITLPKVHVEGTRIMTKKGSPYAVEILVRSKPGEQAQPVPVRVENGLAYVPIRRNQSYEVKVYNSSRYDVATTLTIDGLSWLTFSEIRDPETGKPKYRHLIISRGGTGVFQGWHRTNEVADAFLVNSYAKSAAAGQLRSTAQLGTLVVTFAAAWRANEAPPSDEPKDQPTLGAPLGTGRGERVATRIKETKREVGVVRETVSIRYAK